MKTIAKIVLVICASLCLVGCASGPKFTEMAATLGTMPPADTGRVFIYRTSLFGTGIQPKVKLNGEAIGKAVPGGFFYIDLKPGNYTIATSTEVKRHLSFVLEKGQTKYVRLNVSMGFFVGHVYPELVENSVGEEEIQECSYTGQQK